MISRIQSKFGTAGLVVAIVALVAALTGAAFAAGGLTGQQKKEVKKIAKKYAGKNGAPGAVGPQGPKGDTGAAGTNGTNGTNGTDGKDGTNGKSVVLTAEPAGANCADAGTKVEVEGNAASKKYVCNGKTGFTKTLPKGETETGVWAFGVMPNQDIAYVPVSLNIPLAAAPTVYVIRENGLEKEFPSGTEVEQPKCPGTATEPAAEPGALCVYVQTENNVGLTYVPLVKSYKSGAVVPFLTTNTGASAYGTFAVTAP
jgi:hypothetical protein